ncbi:MAG: class I SAM-dependent methyltransferase [Terrimicrobiaceae bacterium]
MKNPQAWNSSKFVFDGDRIAGPAYDRLLPASYFLNTVMLPEYARIIAEHSARDLLDLGCGTVPYYGIYKNKVSSVHCVDWPNCVHSQEHVDTFCDLNQPLPFEDQQFDTILLTDVLEHIYRPLGLLSEVSRILRPNGKLLLFVPFYYWIHEAPFDYYRYTAHALRRFCDDCRLDVVLLEPYGGFFDVLFDLINKKFFNRRLTAKILVRAVKPLFLSKRYLRIRASTAVNFPLGYCLVAQRLK